VTSGDGDALHIDVGQGSGRGVNIDGDLEVSDSIRADIRTSDTTAIKELAGNNANLFYGPSAAGFGAYAVTVYAVDTSGADTALYGAKISIYSLAGSIIASQSTLSGGYNVFNLDTDSFAVVAARAGYSFPALDTIVVSGAQADTISGYNISVGSPSSADLCRVYGYFYTIEGEPIEGVEVAAELAESGIRHNALIVSPYRQLVLTDSSGYFYLDLIPSSLLSPAGAAYRISAGYPAGTIIRKTVQVPDSTVWQLTW